MITTRPRARRAALGARRSGGIRSGKFRGRPGERLDARNRAGRLVDGNDELYGGLFRSHERNDVRSGATVDTRTAVMVVAGGGRRMVGARRHRRRRRVMLVSRHRSGSRCSADHARLDRLSAQRRNDRPPRPVHRTRLQNPGLPRDQREPHSEQSRQSSEPGLTADHSSRKMTSETGSRKPEWGIRTIG